MHDLRRVISRIIYLLYVLIFHLKISNSYKLWTWNKYLMIIGFALLSHIWIHGKIRYTSMLPLILLQRVGFYTYTSNLHRCIFLFPHIIFNYTLHAIHCKSFFDTKVTHQKSLFCNWYATLRQYLVVPHRLLYKENIKLRYTVAFSHQLFSWY